MEIPHSEAAGAGGRPVLLTPVGLRPPSVSKTDLLNLQLFLLFPSLTSLTNEQIRFETVNFFVERAGMPGGNGAYNNDY